MRILNSLVIAFSMYSRIPMPLLEWNKRDMEYVFCFFPLIGTVIGLVAYLWIFLTRFLQLGTILGAVVCTALPFLLTGGIHLDGFCDTTDALASRQSRERKLEILKDSNVGAFAVIGCCSIFMLYFGVWHQALEDGIGAAIPALIFMLSRTLSGLAAVTTKNARGSGMLFSFTSASAGKRVIITLVVWLGVCAALLLLLGGLTGFAIIGAAAGMYLVYRHVALKNFGGITGDLAGWFLTICELVCLSAAVLCGRLLTL